MASASTRFDPADQALLRQVRALAEEAAQIGGEIARAAFSGNYTVRRKADGTEVTSADDEAQAAIVGFLRGRRADDAFITEEDATPAGPGTPTPVTNDTLCWVIDPLDGTRNFVHGVPLYAVSVAAMFAGFPVVGAVYLPERKELFSSGGPDGFLIDRRPPPPHPPLPPRSGGRPPKPLVGIPSSLQGGTNAVIQSWTGRVVIRNTGATAMHLAMVAAGQLQAALISDSRLWDIAAGWLLVTSTGGVMTALDGRDLFPLDVSRYAGEALPSLAAASPTLHADLLPKP